MSHWCCQPLPRRVVLRGAVATGVGLAAGGLFAAQDLGYFREQGIDFEYLPGQGSGDALKQVLAGNGDVGFVGPEALYFAADQGGDAVGIYNIYPQNVFAIYSWP